MKYLLVMIVGLLLGAVAAGAVLYYNPLTEADGPEPAAADRALHYDLSAQMLGLSLGERALLPSLEQRDTQLWEDTIDRTALMGLVLRDDANQPVAVASRLLVGSASTDLLLHGVLLSDYWLLTFPDEGTLFVRVDTNVWPFLKQALLPVWFFNQPWHGPVEFRPTAGPGAQSTAIVIGASGKFGGVEGSAVERYRVTTLDRASNKAEAVGELHLHFFPPQVAAEQPTPGDG
ncbi:MAG TPA: hypothetical protein VFX89_11210 [Gammaproteobacteria bacterium]|nr:hypothetical protein [Gammaproteobacteria bacterium]